MWCEILKDGTEMWLNSYLSSLFQIGGVRVHSQPLLNVLTMEFKHLLTADFGLVLFNFFQNTLSLTPFSPETFYLSSKIHSHCWCKIISYMFDLLNVIFLSFLLIVYV